METTRSIGRLQVSVAGLGCNNFGPRLDLGQATAVVDAAIDAGVTFLDTANVYGDGTSEEFLGRILRGRWDQVVLATKFGGTRDPALGRPDHVEEALEASLARLGTDHVDCYWLHRPDGITSIGDTLVALDRLITAGKVREIACSNFSAAQLDEATRVAQELGVRPFVAVQNEYSLLHRGAEAEELPACARLGLGFVPYFPLAGGILTGKYRAGRPAPEGSRLSATNAYTDRFLTDSLLAQVEPLDAFARDHGHTLPELALSWLAGVPTVASIIAGASTPEQVRANVAATTAWDLTATERSELDALRTASLT